MIKTLTLHELFFPLLSSTQPGFLIQFPPFLSLPNVQKPAGGVAVLPVKDKKEKEPKEKELKEKEVKEVTNGERQIEFPAPLDSNLIYVRRQTREGSERVAEQVSGGREARRRREGWIVQTRKFPLKSDRHVLDIS